jgi:hypothetical protein
MYGSVLLSGEIHSGVQSGVLKKGSDSADFFSANFTFPVVQENKIKMRAYKKPILLNIHLAFIRDSFVLLV